MSDNQAITADELRRIRLLADFDLTMLLSEIHDHGWPEAKRLLPLIEHANNAQARPTHETPQ